MYFISIKYYFFYSWPAVCIHGDKSQNERDWVLQGKIENFPQNNIFLHFLAKRYENEYVILYFLH